MKPPKKWPRTSPAMFDAMNRLKAEGIRFIRCSEHQLKVGRWNFYPNTGRTFADDELPLERTGVKVLLEVLEQQAEGQQQGASTRDAHRVPGSAALGHDGAGADIRTTFRLVDEKRQPHR